jgi:ABC-type cobalamin/Fe3+-siderophores transport system ATPase subunit
MSRRRTKEAEPEVDDLWKIASQTLAAESANVEVKRETFTLFVGQKQAGKSSLITAFHNPSKVLTRPILYNDSACFISYSAVHTHFAG